jgi:quercetin dioxygenase-like cupin family protein
MITKRALTAAGPPVSARPAHSPFTPPAVTCKPTARRTAWKRGAIVFVAVCALLTGSMMLHGQVSGLQIIPLAQGFSYDKNLNLHVQGPSDVLQSLLVFQPGGDTGWHTHPGPVVVVVKTGALTEYHTNGCITVHPAGSVFFEAKEEVHRAVNQAGGVAEVYATFISPSGAQPLIPAADPGAVCRK